MKFKKTMLASGIIAAALAVSTAAYAVTNEQEAEQRWAERDAEISARLLDEEAERADNGLTAFEEAILRGESPYDFRNADYDKQIASGEIIRFDNSAVVSDDYKLTLVHGAEDGYILWAGTFRVPSVSEFSHTFNDMNYFTVSCNAESATMNIDSNFNGNYKEVSMRRTFLKNGSVSYVTKNSDSTGNTVSVTNTQSDGGELVETTYYFYLYAGSTQSSPLYEVVSIHIVDDNFVETALYKESISAK